MSDTIFALSSGPPPAAIAVVRISGPHAGEALRALAGRLPVPRRASTASLRDPGDGSLLDRALVLWLPGPGTATGEDSAELHLHGGRAVVAAIERALAGLPGLRRAEAGEFTRRAFTNGVIDLAEAEGLADLLAAETELQRRSALAMASGELSRLVEGWRDRVLSLSAQLEASLDFADEDDVAGLPAAFEADCRDLSEALAAWLARPHAELLRDGFRVVIAGPPNAGKSTLFNMLTDTEAAIATPIPGTTRDLLTQPVALDGVPFVFVDTAGLRADSADPVERIGIARAEAASAAADLVLWLGAADERPGGAWQLAPQCDRPDRDAVADPRHAVSALTGEGIASLCADLVATARVAMPAPGAVALGQRQRRLLGECREAVASAAHHPDPLLAAEHLRLARLALDRLIGRSGTEDMLDALFGRFCIGK
ncbi:tRNA uridine-5-carboxymethylaminomethyl(34) synthesis GTPase MnmE [Novosphingobium sp. Gsoil 351]|uniref:tRNA uridine-5-carboxymethylaminomethyl(34) synthesis GTPase MnmE n=1 Tax=Novosphingobium sp. Gsoil 351 TaxID=2675225 RepID=UPI0012B4B661|nr:tRNA uridine-5-carboxymethylaminomethyl(34) synthesis GTPase MnmE [Novosphingobium sp. Gsoil 351]QGN54891.1 tRNA uridine-5-carboxymethylaminomethyl(34) synthesis GTPase MnmE [Novosphingobium sp. Gsoil 351]